MTGLSRTGVRLRSILTLWVCATVFLSVDCRSVCSRATSAAMSPDLAAIVEKGDGAAIQEFIEARLQENLGRMFPDIFLEAGNKERVKVRDFLEGKPLALFFAGGPCPKTLEWSATLENDGWRAEGYEVLPVVKMIDDRLEQALRSNLHGILYSQWPLPSYLTDVRMYPVMFYLSSDGRFMGYQMFGDEPRFLHSLQN